MDDLADFVNTNKEQAGATGEAAQDGKVPEQKEPETQVKHLFQIQLLTNSVTSSSGCHFSDMWTKVCR